MAIQHLRTRDPRWDMRSYVAIHISLIFGVGVLITGSIWAKGAWGIWWVVERADARLVPAGHAALRDLPAAALRDRGPRAPGARGVGVRDHRRRLRADQLRDRAPLDRLPAPAHARQHQRQPARADAGRASTSRWSAITLLWVTLWRYEMASKHATAQLRALRRLLSGDEDDEPVRRSAAPQLTTHGRRRALMLIGSPAAAPHRRALRRGRLHRLRRADPALRRDHGRQAQPHRARARRADRARAQRARARTATSCDRAASSSASPTASRRSSCASASR